jgi:hypothetical protein
LGVDIKLGWKSSSGRSTLFGLFVNDEGERFDDVDCRKDDFEDPTSDFVSETLASIFPKMSGLTSEGSDHAKRVQVPASYKTALAAVA